VKTDAADPRGTSGPTADKAWTASIPLLDHELFCPLRRHALLSANGLRKRIV
jgi:hypothetical protein